MRLLPDCVEETSREELLAQCCFLAFGSITSVSQALNVLLASDLTKTRRHVLGSIEDQSPQLSVVILDGPSFGEKGAFTGTPEVCDRTMST